MQVRAEKGGHADAKDRPSFYEGTPTMFMSLGGMQASPSRRRNSWWFLIKDKGAPVLVPVE